MSTQEIIKIKSGELFQLLIIGFSGILIPVSIVGAILSLFEIVPTVLNKAEYYGVKGFVTGILSIPIYVFLLAGSTWLFLIIGLRVSGIAFNLFRRMTK